MSAILAITGCLAGAGLLVGATNETTDRTPPKGVTVTKDGAWLSSDYIAPEACPGSQKAIGFYRRAYTESRTSMGLEGAVPRVWYGCDAARRRAVMWRTRAADARMKFMQWNSTIGHTVRRLDAGLAGTPMAGLGATLERWGRRYGVSPYFIAGAAGTESSFGAAMCLPFNAWGIGNCGRAWTPPSFGSWDESIAYYARFLAERWPGHSTPFSFRGYAACDDCWGRKTSAHMGRFGVGNSTRYSG